MSGCEVWTIVSSISITQYIWRHIQYCDSTSQVGWTDIQTAFCSLTHHTRRPHTLQFTHTHTHAGTEKESTWSLKKRERENKSSRVDVQNCKDSWAPWQWSQRFWSLSVFSSMWFSWMKPVCSNSGISGILCIPEIPLWGHSQWELLKEKKQDGEKKSAASTLEPACLI